MFLFSFACIYCRLKINLFKQMANLVCTKIFFYLKIIHILYSQVPIKYIFKSTIPVKFIQTLNFAVINFIGNNKSPLLNYPINST